MDDPLPLMRLRATGFYVYRGRTYRQREPFLPRDYHEHSYLMSIGKNGPIFEETYNPMQAAEWLTRELALPVWQKVPYFPAHIVSRDYLPGRIIVGGHIDANGRLLIARNDLWEDLSPNDILYVPLYEGDCEHGGPGTAAKLPCYAENLAFAKSLAGTILGVTYGNGGPEMGLKSRMPRKTDEDRRRLSAAEAALLDELADVADVIGLPLWAGPMSINVACDCYYGNAVFRDRALARGVMCIIYTGWKLAEGLTPPRNPTSRFCPHSEDPPRPVLTDYISGGNFWSGLGWSRRGAARGVSEGDDLKVAALGFKALVNGVPMHEPEPDR